MREGVRPHALRDQDPCTWALNFEPTENFALLRSGICTGARVQTVASLLRGHDHLAIIILEDTPDARPYRLSTDPAGAIGGLP